MIPEDPQTVQSLLELERQVADFVLKVFDDNQNSRLVFHNYELSVGTVTVTKELVASEFTDPEYDPKELILASWFVNVGFLFDQDNPLPHVLREMRRFFNQIDLPEDARFRVVQFLQNIHKGLTPKSIAEKVLSDAWTVARFLDVPEERFSLLHLEWDLFNRRHPEKVTWLEIQQDQLLQINLYTHGARKKYEPVRTRYLIQIREKLKKQQQKKEIQILDDKPKMPFSSLEGDSPLRATQTFFRSNYRNHINLSAIADNKANIMISVNSILISVLITFLSYRNIGETNPMILLPVVVFLVTGLVSLIFAVLSARPKVTMLNQEQSQPKSERLKNIVFFGNFVTLKLEEYEEAMDAMFQNSNLLYGNMVRDLYYLGLVLEKKYRYLTVSYTIFMVGFIATVLSFLVILFT